MATIGLVRTLQMPKQVWQADDGRVFNTEEDCLTYESTDKIMRLLYEENGEKRHWDDEEDLCETACNYYSDAGFEWADAVTTLILLWKATPNRSNLVHHAEYMAEVGRFLKDQLR